MPQDLRMGEIFFQIVNNVDHLLSFHILTVSLKLVFKESYISFKESGGYLNHDFETTSLMRLVSQTCLKRCLDVFRTFPF